MLPFVSNAIWKKFAAAALAATITPVSLEVQTEFEFTNHLRIIAVLVSTIQTCVFVPVPIMAGPLSSAP